MKTLAWILVALSISTLGDVLLKKGSLMQSILGATCFGLTAFPTWKAYHYGSFSTVTILWQSAYLMLGLLVGVTAFGDAFSIRKGIAAVLALCAIVLMEAE